MILCLRAKTALGEVFLVPSPYPRRGRGRGCTPHFKDHASPASTAISSPNRRREGFDNGYTSRKSHGEEASAANRTPRAVALVFHHARALRREETDAERKLWQRLRAKEFAGFKFRRQFPIGDFIADFCCRERKLIVELDGGQHAEPAGMARDSWRTRLLQGRGYRVIRFWDNEVLTNIDGVLQVILEALGETSA